MLDIPTRARSSSISSCSSFSGSPPQLDPSILALLNDFMANKAEEESRFKALEAESAAAQLAGIGLDEDEDLNDLKPIVSLQEYKIAFAEDWQLSQFWYSDAFANRMAELLHAMCTSETKIAFLCSPTAFVAFQHMKQLKGAYLFEFDRRFGVLSPKQYIPYDLDSPDDFPSRFKDYFDIVVADPPFLNEVTNAKLVTTLKQVMKKDAKLILVTSTSVQGVLDKLYVKGPLGPLKKTAMVVEHTQLANDFASWGSWEDADKFGA